MHSSVWAYSSVSESYSDVTMETGVLPEQVVIGFSVQVNPVLEQSQLICPTIVPTFIMFWQ